MNLFSIGRRPGDEDQLTNMFAWLISSVPDVGDALLRLGFGSEALPDIAAIETQYAVPSGYLDLLVKGDGFRLVVESKLGTDYGHDQLGKYLRWLATTRSPGELTGLLTVTKRPAPWPRDDVEFAAANSIAARAGRWEELHDELLPLTADGGLDPLAAQVVREFLEMLTREGLVPIRPLATGELGSHWAEAWGVIRRFIEYFAACRDALAQGLDATPHPNAWSAAADWPYQDFVLGDGARIVIGLGHTDAYESIPRHRHVPILWAGALADTAPNGRQIADALARQRPQGWNRGNGWRGRPTIWCYLADAVGDGDFDDQKRRLAAKASEARDWLMEAHSSTVARRDAATMLDE